MHGASRIQSVDRRALQRVRERGCVREHGDADIGLQQFDQIAFRGDLVAAIDRNAMLAERSAQPVRMFAIISL